MATVTSSSLPAMNASSMATPRIHQPQDMGLFYFTINVLVDGALCLLGYLGNILIVIILRKDGVRTSNSVFLQTLAVTDSCYLTYALLYLVLHSVYPYVGQLEVFYTISDHLVAWVMPFAWTSMTASIWMVMVVALDRYIVVAFPFKASSWCTPARARRVSVGVVLAAIAFNLVRWPRYYFVSFKSKTFTNATFLSHLTEDIPGWNKTLYRDIYHIALTYIFIFITPLSIISVVNMLLIRELQRSSKLRWKMISRTATFDKKARHDRNRHNITLMLVIVITVFLVCQVSDVVGAVMGSGYFYVNVTFYEYYVGIKECLLVFSCAYNFYVYCIFYRRFRRTLVKMFTCRSRSGSPLFTKSCSKVHVYAIKESTRL